MKPRSTDSMSMGDGRPGRRSARLNGLAEDRDLTIEELIIDDGAPVDSIYVEKMQRLLVDALFASWAGPSQGRPFQAFSNVGLFWEKRQTPLVPDMMLVIDYAWPDVTDKKDNSYFLWIVGKPPDVVIEIVSDRRGGEDTYKLQKYASIGVPYYAIYDPQRRLKSDILRTYELNPRAKYKLQKKPWFPSVNLGLTIWHGTHHAITQNWPRWCDVHGSIILASTERLTFERQRADEERLKRERLERRLRELGHEP